MPVERRRVASVLAAGQAAIERYPLGPCRVTRCFAGLEGLGSTTMPMRSSAAAAALRTEASGSRAAARSGCSAERASAPKAPKASAAPAADGHVLVLQALHQHWHGQPRGFRRRGDVR